ncbi:unnamed protein product [Meganyctiphanes norvegica]|uniref:Chitin-binding type-2 domain-containing protein n=1 Tax=Meganyctiphanes norvegica TaxID=48144 RepID=A0AAV2RY94_MEGNR
MKVLFLALALAVTCVVAKPNAAGLSISQEDQTEMKPVLPLELASAPRKWVCYWFGCIWVPGWWPGNTTAAPTTTTTTEAPFVCTSAGLFPDRDDCSKFIQCQDAGDGNFIEHSFSCPHNLFFNPDTNRCDHPENVPSCQI